LHQCNLVKAAT